MATVKRANVAPTHPTVYVGLALAVVGLLIAMFAYTGSRVYDITYAFIAAAGGVLALAGILTAAWGRSIMAARASRNRRATFKADALALSRPDPAADEPAAAPDSRSSPTIAAPREKKRFSFGKKKEEKPVPTAALFAFKRRGPAPTESAAAPADAAVTLTTEPSASPVRVTLKCPQCAATFNAEGVRPFDARCEACGFTSAVAL